MPAPAPAPAPSPAPAPAEAPAPAPAPAPEGMLPGDPPRETLTVRILQAGPLGELGQVRDDLPADWLAALLENGTVELAD